MKRLISRIVLVPSLPCYLFSSNLLRLRNTEKFWPRQTGRKFKQMFTFVGDKFDMPCHTDYMGPTPLEGIFFFQVGISRA